jgi:hypothetical protein
MYPSAIAHLVFPTDAMAEVHKNIDLRYKNGLPDHLMTRKAIQQKSACRSALAICARLCGSWNTYETPAAVTII